MAFNNWPYTNFQDLNLDWILRKLREAVAQATGAAETVAGYNGRLTQLEGDNIELARQIMNNDILDRQQESRINSLETDVEGQEGRVASIEGAQSETEQRLIALESWDNDNVKVTAQDFDATQKGTARHNIGAGVSSVSYNQNTNSLTIINENTGASESVSLDGSSGGTSGIFLITAVYSNGQYTFDRNSADILAAVQAGRLPVVRYHTTNGGASNNIYYVWVFDYYSYDGEDVYIYFSRIDQGGKNAQLRWVGSENKATEMAWPNLPAATGVDNGKIPMVNSFGNYQLVTPSSGSSGIPVITNSGGIVDVSIDPNKFYIFTGPDMLSIDFNAGTSGIVNEYHFRFTSGISATELDLPASVVIPDDFDVAANTVYEVSIIDNYMVYSSWAVNA